MSTLTSNTFSSSSSSSLPLVHDPPHSVASEPAGGSKANEPVVGATAIEPNGVPNEDYSNVVHIFYEPQNKRTFFCCNPSCTDPVHIQKQEDYFDDNNNINDSSVDNVEYHFYQQGIKMGCHLDHTHEHTILGVKSVCKEIGCMPCDHCQGKAHIYDFLCKKCSDKETDKDYYIRIYIECD